MKVDRNAGQSADAAVAELQAENGGGIASIRRPAGVQSTPSPRGASRHSEHPMCPARTPVHIGQADIRIVVDAPDEFAPLPAAVEVAIYRIVEEALTNAVRHARAKSCDVKLTRATGALHLAVKDDGIGLSDCGGGGGVDLISMRERAAARAPATWTLADQHYQQLRLDMQPLLQELGVAAQTTGLSIHRRKRLGLRQLQSAVDRLLAAHRVALRPGRRELVRGQFSLHTRQLRGLWLPGRGEFWAWSRRRACSSGSAATRTWSCAASPYRGTLPVLLNQESANSPVSSR